MLADPDQGLRLETVERTHVEVSQYGQLRHREPVGETPQSSGNAALAGLAFGRCKRSTDGAPHDNSVAVRGKISPSEIVKRGALQKQYDLEDDLRLAHRIHYGECVKCRQALHRDQANAG